MRTFHTDDLLRAIESLFKKTSITTLTIIAGWKRRIWSYHCCWWVFNWIVGKKRAEGELILFCVLPECLVALLSATSARYCRCSPCNCCMCLSSIGWSWSGRTNGTNGKTRTKLFSDSIWVKTTDGISPNFYRKQEFATNSLGFRGSRTLGSSLRPFTEIGV